MDNGANKPGWISHTPGSVLLLNPKVYFPHRGERSEAIVSVSFLTSYEHMGTAVLDCSVGCTCSPLSINAHNPEIRVSVQHSVDIPVQLRGRLCCIAITVCNETTSMEHKFKLVGMEVQY